MESPKRSSWPKRLVLIVVSLLVTAWLIMALVPMVSQLGSIWDNFSQSMTEKTEDLIWPEGVPVNH